MRKVEDLSEQELRDEVRAWRADAAARLNALGAWELSLRRGLDDDTACYVRVNCIRPSVAALQSHMVDGDYAEQTCGEGCGKPIRDGEWVYHFDDVGEIHVDCENPTARPASADPTEDTPHAHQHEDWYSDARCLEYLERAQALLKEADTEDDVERLARTEEHTSERIAAIAAIGLHAPEALTPEQIRAVCGSALTQRPDHKDPA